MADSSGLASMFSLLISSDRNAKMSEKTEYPTRDDLDELQELMKQVDEAEDRITKVVQVAAVDMEFYNDMRELYQRKAAQAAMKDAYYPYTALDGEFMIGTDLEGRPLGVTRRQLNEHMLVCEPKADERTGEAGCRGGGGNIVPRTDREDVPTVRARIQAMITLWLHHPVAVDRVLVAIILTE